MTDVNWLGDNGGMTPGYRIRHARPDDAPRLAVLAAQVWMHTYAKDGVSHIIAGYVLTEMTPQVYAAKLCNPAITILVAERDVHLLGFAVVQSGLVCANAPQATMELTSLYVQAHCKGQGMGSRLLHDARALAAAHASSRLWLTVNAQNVAAIDFYTHRNFQRVSTADFVLGGVAHENWVMQG